MTHHNDADTIRQRGSEYELFYHTIKYKEKGYLPKKRKQFLDAQIAQYLPVGQQSYRILDVGCGPHSTLGATLKDGTKVELYGVDPLNDEYGKMLDSIGIKREYTCVTGTGEDLTKFFDNNYFDIVYSKNALDHSKNPYMAIRAMQSVCKKNGFIIFDVNINEALRTNYNGFHQWNFTNIDAHIILWSYSQSFLLDECIGGLRYSFTVKHGTPSVIRCIIHNIDTDSVDNIELQNGLFVRIDINYGTICFINKSFNNGERFFVHLLRRNIVVEKFSFVWDYSLPLRSFTLPEKIFDSIRIGQYATIYTENKRQNVRFWEKLLPLANPA